MQLALQEFTLEINVDLTSERTAIFGPSGAGKTSLLEVIAGLRDARCEAIRFDGVTFADSSHSLPVRDRQIGYVPQDDLLFPQFDVRRNLLYGRPRIPHNAAFSLEHVTSFLDIESLLRRNVRELSRGERQRVTIGRALLSEPRLLLLDEPLTGLDGRLREIILQQLKSLPNEFKVPILYVTHDRSEAIEVCEEALLLERGKVVGHGPARELLAS